MFFTKHKKQWVVGEELDLRVSTKEKWGFGIRNLEKM